MQAPRPLESIYGTDFTLYIYLLCMVFGPKNYIYNYLQYKLQGLLLIESPEEGQGMPVTLS